MVQPQLKMASIVGMAGVGKTTLAHLVYEEIGNEFQSRAFVSVTPSPNMKEVLTSILQQIGAEPLAGTEAMTEEDVIYTISNFLEDKRYLVITDDIWHRGEWDIISKSFPQNNMGSRIVMTTRIHFLLGDYFDNNKLYIRMNPEWSLKKSKWLYGHDTSWLYGHDRGWLDKLDEGDVAARMKPDMVGEGFDQDHPIVRMCGGVPLALLCLFSAMAMIQEQQEQLGVHVKACDVQDMIEKQVKQSGIQNTPGFEPLVESLQLGYDDLPHHMLKTCLLYCSMYPENHHFRMNAFVMRMVAEGFIHKEDAAEGYLKELKNRGLILGNVTRMNPMMRNFLRWKLREDNFISCSSDITAVHACRIHRLCIDDYPVDDGAAGVDPLFGLDWSQVRSLVVFGGAKRDLPYEGLERVRVLDLRLKEDLENHHVKDICGLVRVRHLFGLEGIGITKIPSEIGRLQYLETLHVVGTSISELPGEIGDLQQLKTLDLSRNKLLAKLPREIGDLQHLETLDLSYSRLKELPREIGNLQNLENLNLHGTKLKGLPREIGKLQHLKTLKMGSAMIRRLPSEIGDLQNLETLDLSLNYRLKELPREIGKLQNLKQLLLSFTNVKIPREIGGLKKLEFLNLYSTISALPWEASQLPKLKGVPECVRQAWKNSDLVSELSREIMSIQMGDMEGLTIDTKHIHIPRWIKDHFNDLGSLDIKICKLEEQDFKTLREMSNLMQLTLRLEVVPRESIAISSEGFPRLEALILHSRTPPVIAFQEAAMPRLKTLQFELRFYGGPPNKKPLGIKHLRILSWVLFGCNQKWYRGAESSRCMSAMIDVVRKEAQEHRNLIRLSVSGLRDEIFPANERFAREVSSSGTGENEEEIMEA